MKVFLCFNILSYICFTFVVSFYCLEAESMIKLEYYVGRSLLLCYFICFALCVQIYQGYVLTTLLK